MTAATTRWRGHLRSAGTATAAAMLVASAALVPVGTRLAPVVLAADDLQGCGRKPLDVELIIDRSGSMGETQWATDGHVRLYWAKQAADGLVDSLDATGGVGGGSNLHHVGLTRFGNGAASVVLPLGTSSASTVKSNIDGLTSSGNTPLRQGMAAGAGDMNANGQASRNGLPVKHVIILLSDGRPNPDNTNASGARPTQANIDAFRGSADVVYSIAVGEGGTGLSQVDLALMESLAKPTPGAYRHVVQGSDLPALFDGIFEDIACTPGIKIVKTASPTELPAGGGDVTYTFKVTNVGNVALTNVDVSDNPSCGSISFDGGDTDGDNKLDIDETWLFSCTSNVTESVTDTGKATGHDGNTKVEDTSQAHVDVADPTPTPEPTPTPTDPEPTPTDAQPTPTEAQPTPTEAQPTGEVKGQTGKPRTTLPPTDMLDGSNGGTGSGLPIVLIALLGIAVAIGLLSPSSNRSRRRSRRE